MSRGHGDVEILKLVASAIPRRWPPPSGHRSSSKMYLLVGQSFEARIEGLKIDVFSRSQTLQPFFHHVAARPAGQVILFSFSPTDCES